MTRTVRTHYVIGTLLLVSGLVHLAVLIGSGGTWSGPLSWRKPATFGLSFGLTLISLAWVASFLPFGGRARRWWLGVLAAACVTEVTLITVQAWRHVPSHFNMETPVDTAISRVLAAGGGVLIVTIVAFIVVSWRPARQWRAHQEPTRREAVAPSMRLAVRAGLLALGSALLIGAIMVLQAVLDVVGGDQQAAYAVGARWKPAHFVPMHGVLALPLLAWLLARTGLSERQRYRIVAVAVAGYAVLCVLAVAESAAGVDPVHAPVVLDAVALAAVAIIGTAGWRTLRALGEARRGTFRTTTGSLPGRGR